MSLLIDYTKEVNNLGQKSRKDYAIKMISKFSVDAYVENGIVRWKSNDHIPPQDILELWDYVNKDFDYKNSIAVQNKEDAEFFEQYRKANANRVVSAEERFELECNFGEDETVVDIITSQVLKRKR